MSYFKKFAIAAATSLPLIGAGVTSAKADTDACMENMMAGTNRNYTKASAAGKIVMDYYLDRAHITDEENQFYRRLHAFAAVNREKFEEDVAAGYCKVGGATEGASFTTARGQLDVPFSPNFATQFNQETAGMTPVPKVITRYEYIESEPEVYYVPGYRDRDYRRNWRRDFNNHSRYRNNDYNNYRNYRRDFNNQSYDRRRERALDRQQRNIYRNLERSERFMDRARSNPRRIHPDGPRQGGWGNRNGGQRFNNGGRSFRQYEHRARGHSKGIQHRR